MSRDHRPTFDPSLSRRDLLRRGGMGFGLLGLAGLATEESARAGGGGATKNPLTPRSPHFPGKARQVVHLFMNGGPSQVDTFDPKPLLEKYHGKPTPSPNLRTERKTGAVMRSPYSFKKYGQSGLEVSELFAKTAAFADDLCVIRSMQADVPNHEPSLLLMNCGDGRLSRPSMGAWVTYGLGSENQNLPGFIALCPGGYSRSSPPRNRRSSGPPGAYQGTHVDTAQTDVRKLIENIRNDSLALDVQAASSCDLAPPPEARSTCAEAPARPPARSPDPVVRAGLPDAVGGGRRLRRLARRSPGIGPQGIRRRRAAGRQLLIARRLVERGVRFIQVWAGAGQPWDNHEELEKNHRELGRTFDGPIAAFLGDLKRRGLLDTTLVIWGGEFGRTPVAELPNLNGRDHNHYGFSMWMAGGGVKGGHVHGATDDLGFAAVENKVHVHDLHATLLHLLGFDHTKLTYRFQGRDFRLTDVHGKVVESILA